MTRLASHINRFVGGTGLIDGQLYELRYYGVGLAYLALPVHRSTEDM